MQKVLVTGATGHIGNVLIRELLAQGCVVRALVLPNDDCRALNSLNVEIVHGDITDPAELLYLPPLKDTSFMLDWELRKGATDGQKILHSRADYQ